MALFANRVDAARQLAQLLRKRGYEQPVVLGIPRGGVVISSEIAQQLDADHGVVVARKLGAPFQAELAIGAITASGATFIDSETVALAGVDDEYLERVKKEQQAEAQRREEEFDSRRRPAVEGRTVLIVDDGVATGCTAIAAIRAIKQEGARRVVFAVPVGPPHTIATLREEADEVIFLHEEPSFFAVGQFYKDFAPTTELDVHVILDEFERRRVSAEQHAG